MGRRALKKAAVEVVESKPLRIILEIDLEKATQAVVRGLEKGLNAMVGRKTAGKKMVVGPTKKRKEIPGGP